MDGRIIVYSDDSEREVRAVPVTSLHSLDDLNNTFPCTAWKGGQKDPKKEREKSKIGD